MNEQSKNKDRTKDKKKSWHLKNLVHTFDVIIIINNYASAVNTSWLANSFVLRKYNDSVDCEVQTALSYIVMLMVTSKVFVRLKGLGIYKKKYMDYDWFGPV